MLFKIKNIVSFTSRSKEEKGVVVIIVALLLVGLVGMLAYVIDTGSIYQERSDLQSVTDAAALAGVQNLPENPAIAVQTAIDYAATNGFTISSSDITISNTYVNNDTITVRAVDSSKSLFFGGVFGIDTTSVGATATAVIGSPDEIKTGVVPWAVLEGTYNSGEVYDLKYGDPSLGPGNFGAVAIDGRGASTYRECTENGCTTPLHIGSVIETETGNMSGPTSQGTSARVYDYENHLFDTFSQLTTYSGGIYSRAKDDSQYIIVPIVDHFPNGRHDVTIVGFLQFIITYLNGSVVKGTLIDNSILQSSDGIHGVDETGFRVIRLID